MKRSFWMAALAICALLPGAAALPQAAEAAAPAHKAANPVPAPKPVSTVKVIITNSRPASLVELRAGVSGSGKMRKVLGSLRPGKDAVAHLPRGEGCEVDLHGAFDDGQTINSTGVDICAEHTVNLTD